MSALEPLGDSIAPSRSDRLAARAIVRSRATTAVRLTSINHEADAVVEVVNEIGFITATAMQNIGKVGAVQLALEAQNPAISGHLAGLATLHAAEMMSSLEQGARALRRK